MEKLIWSCSWYHYSPAYQWRGSTQRAPCRNKEAEEEASAFPPPCPDEPPTENTKSSARLTSKFHTAGTSSNIYCRFWFNSFIPNWKGGQITSYNYNTTQNITLRVDFPLNSLTLAFKQKLEHSLTAGWTLAALLNSVLYVHQTYFVKLITSVSNKGMMQRSEIEEQDCGAGRSSSATQLLKSRSAGNFFHTWSGHVPKLLINKAE